MKQMVIDPENGYCLRHVAIKIHLCNQNRHADSYQGHYYRGGGSVSTHLGHFAFISLFVHWMRKLSSEGDMEIL